MDEILANPKFITRDKNELAVSLSMPKELLTFAWGNRVDGHSRPDPAGVQSTRGGGPCIGANNLKQIGLGIMNYESTYGHLPHDITDKNGKPILSWRVAILPYIEQANLYNRFKLDEPWDSDNNKPWSQAIIKTYLSAEAKLPEKMEFGLTSYRGISGPSAAFEPGKKIKLTDFTDGTSNTIMVIETDELVPWAKPGDYPFDPKKPLPKIVPVGNRKVFQALFADGSVRAMKGDTSEKLLKALFTRNGGEVVDLDKDK